MKRFVLLWLVFLVFALSPARAAEPYISVDFRLSWGVPWVDVELSGSTYSFVLDTGAKFTVLSSGVADVVSPGWDKRGRRSDLSLRIRVRNMSIGGKQLPAIKAAVLDGDNFTFRCVGADGILGMDVLGKYTLVFDYNENAISFYDKKVDEDGLLWWQMATDNGGRPFFKGRLGTGDGQSEETYLFFDSGNGRDAVIFTEKVAESYLHVLDSLEHATGFSGINIDGTGSARPIYRGVLPDLGFGDAGFLNIPVREGHAPVPYPLLPARITLFGRLLLDFPGKRYAYIPYELKASSWSIPRQRVQTMIENGRIVIGAVWEERLRDVVKHGDVIERVGDTAFPDQDECTHRGIDYLVKRYATPENYTVSVRSADGMLHILPAELFLNY